MDSLNKLTEYFREFPGIGPRQARRFAYFLLTKSPSYADELARLVVEIKKNMRVCDLCFRFYPAKNTNALQNGANTITICNICSNTERNHSELMIVARDVDLEAIEKSGTYNGFYFVLGGTVPILEKSPESRIRSRELLKRIETTENKKSEQTKEIILSLSTTPEGEHTEEILRLLLKPAAEKAGIKITVLGRGLSTGAELEYSDADTIKNALKNRA